MVQDSGKKIRAETISLNKPEPVRVQEDASSLPVAVKASHRQLIKSIEGRWRIDDEWWRTVPISRLYYAVVLASGQRLVLYKDLATNSWYRQAG